MPGGRPPKPTALKLLEGNAGHRPLPDLQPTPPPGDVQPPEWLGQRALELWKQIAPILEPMGLLTTADPHALAMLCDSYAEYIDARAIVTRRGRSYLVKTENGKRYLPRPEVAIAADAWRQVLRLLTEFGMTPSSRSRVKAAPPAEEDPFESYLSGRAN